MDDEDNIEIASDKPQLDEITEELEQAQTDANWFYRRMEQARAWWYSQWPGQTVDGRKHAAYQQDCFPWEGASDSRLRIVSTLISDQVSVRKFAFFQSKIQARSVRPMVQARESNKSTKLLQWVIYNHMWPQVLREVPLVYNWWQGYGVGFMGVEWEQQRRLDYQTITLQTLAEIMGAMGGEPLPWLDALTDPTQEDGLTTLLQQLSPILSRPDARNIVQDLRETGTAE